MSCGKDAVDLPPGRMFIVKGLSCALEGSLSANR